MTGRAMKAAWTGLNQPRPVAQAPMGGGPAWGNIAPRDPPSPPLDDPHDGLALPATAAATATATTTAAATATRAPAA